jgi:hypothetical protein
VFEHKQGRSVLYTCFLQVAHPDHGTVTLTVENVPSEVALVLKPANMVTGRVIEKSTGLPRAGVGVYAKSIHARVESPLQAVGMRGGDSNAWTTTDDNGEFRMPLAADLAFSVWLQDTALDAAAQQVEAQSGQQIRLPDFELEPRITVNGKVIDDATDMPIVLAEHELLCINCYDPSRPKSTGPCRGAQVKQDGSFALDVVGGLIHPYVGSSGFEDVDGKRYAAGINATKDQPIELEFRVRRAPRRLWPWEPGYDGE